MNNTTLVEGGYSCDHLTRQIEKERFVDTDRLSIHKVLMCMHVHVAQGWPMMGFSDLGTVSKNDTQLLNEFNEHTV